MKAVLLVTKEMEPIPDKIKVLANWGWVTVVNKKNGEHLDGGNHQMLEGEPFDFAKWLVKLDGVWVGKGSPMLQQFEIRHVDFEDIEEAGAEGKLL